MSGKSCGWFSFWSWMNSRGSSTVDQCDMNHSHRTFCFQFFVFFRVKRWNERELKANVLFCLQFVVLECVFCSVVFFSLLLCFHIRSTYIRLMWHFLMMYNTPFSWIGHLQMKYFAKFFKLYKSEWEKLTKKNKENHKRKKIKCTNKERNFAL